MNMERAAHTARDAGRLDHAVVKYVKAARYLQLSLSEYEEDSEMSEWTQIRFHECLDQLSLLRGPAERELIPSPDWLLFLHQDITARQESVALVEGEAVARAACNNRNP
jgi:hypothetical protein